MQQEVVAIILSSKEHWGSTQTFQEQDIVYDFEVVQSVSNPEILFNIIMPSICPLTLLTLITSSDVVPIVIIFVLFVHLELSSKSYLLEFVYEFIIAQR
jgi:hypothetical protein